MLDRPDADAILEEVGKGLRAGIPEGFAQKVAANAVALARREHALGEPGHAAERARLAALLGHDGEIEALNRELAQAIREGRIDRAEPALERHLVLTTIAKMAVDQPNYPAFARLCPGETS